MHVHRLTQVMVQFVLMVRSTQKPLRNWQKHFDTYEDGYYDEYNDTHFLRVDRDWPEDGRRCYRS